MKTSGTKKTRRAFGLLLQADGRSCRAEEERGKAKGRAAKARAMLAAILLCIQHYHYVWVVGNFLSFPYAAVDTSFNCSFENGPCGWTQSLEDDYNWALEKEETTTPDTGPNNDHTFESKFFFKVLI